MKIFVSYCHQQQDWLKRNLLPLLKLAGHEVLMDISHFSAGPPVVGQMDATQDQADMQLLFMSQAYLKSPNCMHEFDRAVDRWGFAGKQIIPVFYEDVTTRPQALKDANPLWVGALKDWNAANWALLGKTFGIDVGIALESWVQARNKVMRHLERDDSVNLVTSEGVKWNLLIKSLEDEDAIRLKTLDFYAGYTTSLPHLVQRILGLAGIKRNLSQIPLPDLSSELEALAQPSRQAWLHFSRAMERSQANNGSGVFDSDFFASVAYLTMQRKLVLLIQSRQPVGEWLDENHQMSQIDFKTVNL